MERKERIRRFNKELKEFEKLYPTCKSHWIQKTKTTLIYICDNVNDPIRVVGYIK